MQFCKRNIKKRLDQQNKLISQLTKPAKQTIIHIQKSKFRKKIFFFSKKQTKQNRAQFTGKKKRNKNQMKRKIASSFKI